MSEQRLGYSIRALERAYGVGRDHWSAAIRAGELPAVRLGRRRLLVLRADAEAWLARHRVRATSQAEAVVAEVLAREERRAG